MILSMLDASELDSIKNQSITSAIARQLEKLILSGEFAPGERINESQLSSKLGVSRAPIREACRQLEKFGMVEVRVGKGTFVKSVSQEEALELYEIRTTLELLACEKAATSQNRHHLEILQLLIDEMEEYAKQNDIQSYLKTNLKFHFEIFRMAGNKSLLALLENITRKLTLFRANILSRPGELFASLKEHKEIHAALSDGDQELAKQIIRVHVTKGMRALQEERNCKDQASA